MNYYRKSKFIALLTMVLVLLITGSGLTKEISLKEAIDWGLKHNHSLDEIEYELNQTELELAKIKTKLGWQMRLSVVPSYRVETETVSTLIDLGGKFAIVPTTEQERTKNKELIMKLEGSKKFTSGLELKQNLVLNETDTFNFNNLDDKTNLKIGFNQDIYPQLPIPIEQKEHSIYNNLVKIKEKLNWERRSKKIEWLANYLNLLRLQQKLKIVKENYQLAKDDWEQVLIEKKINEADRIQVLMAKVNLKKAKFKLNQVKNELNQQYDSWLQKLSLSKDKQVVFSEQSFYLQQIREFINEAQINLDNKVGLVEEAVVNNWQLKANRLDQKLVFKQKKWRQLEDKPQIEFGGNYASSSEDWLLQMSLTYDLFDGGQQNLLVKDYQKQAVKLDHDYRNLIESLRLEINRLIDQLKQAQLNLEEKELALEKAELEKEISKEQLKQGLINEKEFTKKEILFKQAEVDLKVAQDNILLSQLRLVHFLGLDKRLDGERG